MAKKTHWAIFTLCFIMFFLSLTLFSGSGLSLAVFGVSPILTLSILTVFSSNSRFSTACLTGILCGIVMDSISMDCYCYNTIALMVIGVLSHLLSQSVFNRNLKATITLNLILTFSYYLFYWLIFIAFTISFKDSMRYISQWCLPSSVYTALLSVPFYFIFNKFEGIKSLD